MKAKGMKIAGVLLAVIVAAGAFAGCGAKKDEAAAASSAGKAASASSASEAAPAAGEFSEFTAQDLDGNEVDQSIIKGHKATVLNFWFNGCSACVGEMPDLENLNKQLEEKGAQIVGINVGLEKDADIEEAKNILKEQGVTYQNVALTGGDAAVGYMTQLMAFPTTVIVDENGNIIGEPICGSVNEEMMQDILNRVDDIVNASK